MDKYLFNKYFNESIQTTKPKMSNTNQHKYDNPSMEKLLPAENAEGVKRYLNVDNNIYKTQLQQDDNKTNSRSKLLNTSKNMVNKAESDRRELEKHKPLLNDILSNSSDDTTKFPPAPKPVVATAPKSKPTPVKPTPVPSITKSVIDDLSNQYKHLSLGQQALMIASVTGLSVAVIASKLKKRKEDKEDKPIKEAVNQYQRGNPYANAVPSGAKVAMGQKAPLVNAGAPRPVPGPARPQQAAAPVQNPTPKPTSAPIPAVKPQVKQNEPATPTQAFVGSIGKDISALGNRFNGLPPAQRYAAIAAAIGVSAGAVAAYFKNKKRVQDEDLKG